MIAIPLSMLFLVFAAVGSFIAWHYGSRCSAPRWELRMRALRKPRHLAGMLARHMGVVLASELRMIYWRSYKLRGYAGESRNPEINVCLCILFGPSVTQRQMQFFEDLNADRIEIFIDRTSTQDAGARMVRMNLSPRLRYLVLTEKELAAQMAAAESPRAHLTAMVKRAGGWEVEDKRGRVWTMPQVGGEGKRCAGAEAWEQVP